MLNVGRIKVLCEVVRRGSFSGAAEALSYTQSAVSQAIARLEAETGATLIVRDRGGVRPTAAGASLVEHAEGIFAQIDAAETELAAVLGVRAGRLRVASFPSAGATLMPLAIATFRRRHPDVALTLAEGEPEDIAPRLRAGEFDLALLFEFPGARERVGARLRTEQLLVDPMHVALPAEHPLADKPRLTLVDLRDQDWVQTSATSPCARHVVRSCVAAGFEPKVTFESDDYETVQGLVAAGVGVALIPRLALTHVHPGVVVRDLAPRSPARRVVAATIGAPGVSPAAATMIGILADAAKRYTRGDSVLSAVGARAGSGTNAAA
jgi:DNA-binding transcriptional LysR family regulator